ncbi:MAG: ribosomal protein S18-alanine N-acetyltransferase [Clostridia bacterium]|nr:ribosomal protein S18-alanine N-acetyltransferase [Clostridia bacterium]
MTAALRITPVTLADLPRLMELERESFSDPWSESAMAATLEIPVVRALAARRGEQIVGFVIAYLIPPEGEIADICVATSERGQGIGARLLQALTEESDCTEFWLEVRASNLPARRLYEKQGFEAVGLRKHYYDYPREDAVVMRLCRGEKSE